MRSLPLPFLMLALACAGDVDTTDDPLDGVVSSALEGTREGDGVLRLLNDVEGTTFEFLDDVVALDRRAAANLVAHRDGADGEPGTSDDDLFDTIGEVDAVSWVGPAAIETLTEFARLNDYLPGDDEPMGRFDGVLVTYAEAEAILAFVNVATEAELAEANVPTRGAESILEARPIANMSTLSDLYWIGPRTLEYLLEAVTVRSSVAGGEPCESHDECGDGLRCVGRPDGFHGLCRDTSNRDGFQEECDVDTDCNAGLICIGQTVYGEGYCADDWMRGTYGSGGVASIPETVMTEPTAFPFWVNGQASVPEDIFVELDVAHTDPSSLWIGLQPPTGQEPVTLFDGSLDEGPVPTRIVDRGVYRDDAVNGRWSILVQNVGGRGEGTFGPFSVTITSRWD